MNFPWEARVPVNPGRGRQTEMKDKMVRPGRGKKGCPGFLGKGGEGRAWKRYARLRDY
jgi:hypothetical protein